MRISNVYSCFVSIPIPFVSFKPLPMWMFLFSSSRPGGLRSSFVNREALILFHSSVNPKNMTWLMVLVRINEFDFTKVSTASFSYFPFTIPERTNCNWMSTFTVRSFLRTINSELFVAVHNFWCTGFGEPLRMQLDGSRLLYVAVVTSSNPVAYILTKSMLCDRSVLCTVTRIFEKNHKLHSSILQFLLLISEQTHYKIFT